MFVLLAIDSIVERAVGEAIGVIPRLSADHPSLISVSIELFAVIYTDAEPHFLTTAAKRPGYPGYGQV